VKTVLVELARLGNAERSFRWRGQGPSRANHLHIDFISHGRGTPKQEELGRTFLRLSPVRNFYRTSWRRAGNEWGAKNLIPSYPSQEDNVFVQEEIPKVENPILLPVVVL